MHILNENTPDGDGGRDGARRRDVALALLSATRATVIRSVQRAAVQIAMERRVVTADDVRAVVAIPEGVNPVVAGAAFNGLAGIGIFRGGAYVPSRRAAAHARPVRVWHLVSADRAVEWLRNHPPDTETSS